VKQKIRSERKKGLMGENVKFEELKSWKRIVGFACVFLKEEVTAGC